MVSNDKIFNFMSTIYCLINKFFQYHPANIHIFLLLCRSFKKNVTGHNMVSERHSLRETIA
jgi:hypothetical protein